MATREEFSAGGVVIRSQPELEIACARRRNLGGRTVWCLPKGLVEPGESPPETCLREVREETGIEGEVLEELGEIRYFYYDRGRRERVDKRVRFFLVRSLREDPGRRDQEMEEVRWCSAADALARLTYPGEREMARKALELTAHRRLPPTP